MNDVDDFVTKTVCNSSGYIPCYSICSKIMDTELQNYNLLALTR